MSSDPWLILDMDGLCHRSWHIANFQGQKYGVIYGVLRDISILQERFNTANICFCFDDGEPLRKSIYPNYKANRNREGKQSLYSQIAMLKTQALLKIGFSNIFFQAGYEADDWLAYISCAMLPDYECILVTRDHDMHQLLTKDDRVICYDPQIKSHYGWGMFVAERSITPDQLPKVMALTGCKTDNIEGIRGVGPETAEKIVLGKPVSDMISAKWRAFCDEGKYDLNLQLVTLPWPGLADLEPWEDNDKVTQQKWLKVCDALSLDSLVPCCPRVSNV